MEKRDSGGKKRTFREDWKILMRGIGLLIEISPQYFVCNIIFQIGRIVSPYFALYMSARLVNELSGRCEPGRLLALAAATVTGLFLIKALNRLVQARRNIWFDVCFQQKEIYIFHQQNGFQYEHLENAEVTLLREKIFAGENATGRGLASLFGAIPDLARNMADLAVSVTLTFSMFRLVPDTGLGGFLAFVNSPLCAVLLVAVLLLYVAVSVRLTKEQAQKSMKNMSELAEGNTVWSAYNGIRGEDVTLFNLKKMILNKYEKMMRPPWLLEEEKIGIRYGAAGVFLRGVPDLAVFLVTAAKAFLGVFGIGNFILYRGTVNRFVEAVTHLSTNIAAIRENNTYLLDLYRFLDLPDDMYHGTLAVEKREDIDYEIEFRDVSFRYPNTDTWVLRNVSMKFRVGDKLALVGENGSGKTTFIKLLCRLYDPTEGKILLNGIDITRYRYEEYLALFSVVFQDYKLFQFSLAANVSGTFDYGEERVRACLVQAGFGDKLAELEKGVGTVLGRDYEDDGIDLSGGEEQKVALARALYKDAPFVVLDEPTAALDPIAEAAVYESFRRLVEKKTAVFISHRLSSCRFCDDIIVFDAGRLVQRGSHEALASSAGKYSELWNAQARYYS